VPGGNPFNWLDALVASCLLPLALFILINGLDDLILDAAVAWSWLQGRRAGRLAGESRRDGAPVPEKRLAIFVPLWREHEVIAGMVGHNMAAIRYRNYDFFIGAYPNDDLTLHAVRELEQRYSNVHLAVCAHDGPTSKADCLNWIYQRMLLFEDERDARFDVVVTHDAEDLIHPDSLAEINRWAGDYQMVQIPVLPLPTSLRDVIRGVYCDEFAEYQNKDIPARQILGAFLPSNGVGTGFTRAALEKLASRHRNQIFDPVCLTEDYENGLRLHRHGFRQKFVRLNPGPDPVATRELFPPTLRAAIRQRTRWITGISLQSWAIDGWRGGLSQRYWFWRDRKGLLANPAGMFANILFAYGVLTWVLAHCAGCAWALGRHAPHPAIFAAILTLQLFHLGIRVLCVRAHFGWRFASLVPLRMVLGNFINCIATLRAEYRFLRAKLLHEPLAWLKTDHAYPSRAALLPHKRRLGEILTGSAYVAEDALQRALATQQPGVRLGEHLVSLGLLSEDDLYEALGLQHGLDAGPLAAAAVKRRVARALPRAIAMRWKVLPFRIAGGAMDIASSEIPSEEVTRVLRSHTSLELRFHLVTPTNFSELSEAML